MFIYQASKDFNYCKRVEKLCKDIPILSFHKGEFIIVTHYPNSAGWAEGYCLYRNVLELGNQILLKLGLFHISFATLINFSTANRR